MSYENIEEKLKPTRLDFKDLIYEQISAPNIGEPVDRLIHLGITGTNPPHGIPRYSTDTNEALRGLMASMSQVDDVKFVEIKWDKGLGHLSVKVKDGKNVDVHHGIADRPEFLALTIAKITLCILWRKLAHETNVH